ncbi:ATP-binding protein [bacterium]|nr:ATP-binding protein [bacterium]
MRKAEKQDAYVIETLKVIQGGLEGDKRKVVAYAEQLARRLEESGQTYYASRVRSVIDSASKKQSMVLKPSQMVPVDSEARISLADELLVNPQKIEIFLDEETIFDVSKFLKLVQGADKLELKGMRVSPSLLIYGPPGVGKSELAKWISAQLQLPLLIARADALISSYLGSTAKNIRLLFEHASSRPCILFLDEFDAIAKLRDDKHELGELKRVVIGLLQNIDALNQQTVLIAATNHHHLLDPAVWRRFSMKLLLQPPSKVLRKQMLEYWLDDFSDAVDIEEYAKLAEGLNGADLKTLCEEAKRLAILNDEAAIDKHLLTRGILIQVFGTSFKQVGRWREEVKKLYSENRRLLKLELLAELYGVSKSQIHRIVKSG